MHVQSLPRLDEAILEFSAPTTHMFSALIAVTRPALYILLASAWALIKTGHALFNKPLLWPHSSILPMGVALLPVSIVTSLGSSTIADKWLPTND